jgi:3-dehydroquinate synthetase
MSSLAAERALAILTRLGFLMPKEFIRKFCVMARSKLLKLVSEDKKLIDTRNLNFVFLERIGAAFRKKVTLDFFLTETQRQGWTYA